MAMRRRVRGLFAVRTCDHEPRVRLGAKGELPQHTVVLDEHQQILTRALEIAYDPEHSCLQSQTGRD
jgi:hypothetical protein